MKRLIVLTPPRFFLGEGSIINGLFKEGLACLHIRKPGCTVGEMVDLLNNIELAYYPRIVLHDCFELGTTHPVGGLHLNKRNSAVPEGFTGSISRSCHTLEEVQTSTDFSYVFLSPIFDSISKEGYGSRFPMNVLKEASAQHIINEQVIALGGINAVTIPLVKQLNFGGVAVLGALWGTNPSANDSDMIITQFKLLHI